MKHILIFVIMGWVLRIVVMLVVAFVFLGGALALVLGNSTPPSLDKAQYAIQTYSDDELRVPSRIYFTDEIIPEGNLPTVKDYWWFDGEKYKHTKELKVFTEPTKIVRRTQ